jgi:succinate dehydrogenase/fumarate reductase flavoprotein subunit
MQKGREMEKGGVSYATMTGKVEMMWCGVGTTEWGYGGVRVNTKCETNVPGLYAAGDSAGTGFCGSMYPGTGYGIAGASVAGCIAGERASQHALEDKETTINNEEVERLKELVYTPLSRKGGFSPAYVTEILRNLMVPYYVMGIKHGDRLQATLTMVKFVENHLVPLLKANDAHELRLAHEVRNMSLDAEIILRSSLFRTESRGTHYREDYPRRDDPNWLAWTIAKEEHGEMKLSKLPMPKEWWPDLSKSYEERYPLRFPGE